MHLHTNHIYIYGNIRSTSFSFSKAMKSGLYDVLPSYVLESLSAEDMRLLLCGCQQVDIDTLKKITVFSDESSKSTFMCLTHTRCTFHCRLN